jgi:hypothetical protein
MYSKRSWGGAVDPYIDVLFIKDEASQTNVSLVIFEYEDKSLLGRQDVDNPDIVRWVPRIYLLKC